MATNGNFLNGDIEFIWSVKSQNPIPNSTTIQYQILAHLENLTIDTDDGNTTLSLAYNGYCRIYTFKPDGYAYNFDYNYITDSKMPLTVPVNKPAVIFEGEVTIPHQTENGESFSVAMNGLDIRYTDKWDISRELANNNTSTSFALDAIDRTARLVSVPVSMTDEDTLTITYSNPMGDAATVLKAGISLTTSDSDMAIPYRNLTKTASSYTFNFSATELSALYTILDSGASSARLRLFMTSTANGKTFTDNRDINLTFINYKPTIDVQLRATDSLTLNATGDEKVFINGVSDIYFNLNPSIKKGAQQSSIWIGNGGNDQYTATGYLNNVTTNFFSASLTDNRGYRASEDITLGQGKWSSYRWVEYFPLTLKVSQSLLAANGKLDVTLTGKFFSGNFGKKANSFKYQYNIRKTTSGTDNWSSLIAVSPDDMNIDNQGNYSYTFTINGLDYTSRYALTVDAVDEIMSDMAETSTVVGAIPVFDWGKDDFNFNVPVTFGAGFYVPSNAFKVLVNGQFRLETSSAGIDLPETISSQATGIVLIFTPYNSSTGYADDTKCMPFFISKKAVEYARATNNLSNPLYTFFLMDKADFSTIGSKSVYIGDQRIAGYNTNTQSGTNNGITFDNNKFCLRTILGV